MTTEMNQRIDRTDSDKLAECMTVVMVANDHNRMIMVLIEELIAMEVEQAST